MTQEEGDSTDPEAVFRRYITDVVNAQSPESIEEICGDDFVRHTPSSDPEEVEDLKEYYNYLFEGFPDYHVTIQQVLTDGNHVAARVRVTGTHEGPLHDIKPTGNEIEYSEQLIARIEGGSIMELWEIYDRLSLYEQMGGATTSERTGQH